jgi:hypothetical protein
MSFRNTIDPTVGKRRQNAGKSYRESGVIATTDNSISPIRMFRKNAGKIYTDELDQQILEITRAELMRVGGKRRGSIQIVEVEVPVGAGDESPIFYPSNNILNTTAFINLPNNYFVDLSFSSTPIARGF